MDNRDEKPTLATEALAGLKVSARSLGLVVIAALFWHLPSETSALRWPFAAASILALLPAVLGLLVSSIAWRNIFWRSLVSRDENQSPGRFTTVLISIPFVLASFVIAAALFTGIGIFTG